MMAPTKASDQTVLFAAAFVLSVAFLVAPAVYNGFPLTFYDTGGYLERWFDHTVTIGRSMAYGFFLGLSSGYLTATQGSLWGPVVIQAAWTVWVIHLTTRGLSLPSRPLALVLTVAALAVITGMPWFAAQLMPDSLEPVMVLALFLLTFRHRDLGRWERAGLGALIALAVASHMSHAGVGVGLVMVPALIKAGRWFRRRPSAGAITPGIPALAVVGGMAALVALNGLVGGHFVLTRGGEAFFFGRLVQDGIVQRFLDEHCPAPAYRLCAYRTRIPKTANDWLWGGGSPLEALGGWDGGREEMALIIHDSIRAYPLAHIQTALTSTLEQLVRVRSGDGLVETDHYNTDYIFTRHLPLETPAYSASRQHHDGIDFITLNHIEVPVALTAFAVLSIMTLWLFWRGKQPDLAMFGGFVMVSLVGNAFICGAFSNPCDRYQNRLIWLAVFWLILFGRRHFTAVSKT